MRPAEATEDGSGPPGMRSGSESRESAPKDSHPGCVSTLCRVPCGACTCVSLEASPAPCKSFISINLEIKKLRVQPAFCDLPKVTRGGSGLGTNEYKSVQPLSLCPLLPTECLQRGRGAAAGPWGGHEGAAVGQARESTQRDRGQERSWKATQAGRDPRGHCAT